MNEYVLLKNIKNVQLAQHQKHPQNYASMFTEPSARGCSHNLEQKMCSLYTRQYDTDPEIPRKTRDEQNRRQ